MKIFGTNSKAENDAKLVQIYIAIISSTQVELLYENELLTFPFLVNNIYEQYHCCFYGDRFGRDNGTGCLAHQAKIATMKETLNIYKKI